MSIGSARCAVGRWRVITCACLEYRVHLTVVSRYFIGTKGILL